MDCAAGTVCLGSTRGESPCKWPTGGESPAQTCPNGDGACTGDNTFCSGGLNFTCPGGAVCRAGCCVYQTRERPRLRLCSPCLPGVCMAPWMQAARCALLAPARRKPLCTSHRSLLQCLPPASLFLRHCSLLCPQPMTHTAPGARAATELPAQQAPRRSASGAP